MKTGKLITLEGIDGAGKTTHLPFIVHLLEALGITVVATREPGGTQLGEALRGLLLQHTMHVETETLLMFAARREHIHKVIMPALMRGDWVVSDRFTDATFAYQGGGRKLSTTKLEALEQWVHPELQPDLTLLFDLPLDVARTRFSSKRHLDKFEHEQVTFFVNARTEYLRRAAQFPDRFRLIDANRSIKEVQNELHQIIHGMEWAP